MHYTGTTIPDFSTVIWLQSYYLLAIFVLSRQLLLEKFDITGFFDLFGPIPGVSDNIHRIFRTGANYTAGVVALNMSAMHVSILAYVSLSWESVLPRNFDKIEYLFNAVMERFKYILVMRSRRISIKTMRSSYSALKYILCKILDAMRYVVWRIGNNFQIRTLT